MHPGAGESRRVTSQGDCSGYLAVQTPNQGCDGRTDETGHRQSGRQVVIAFDTNVLSYASSSKTTWSQSQRARSLIEEQFGRGLPCFVPDIVLVELVWVLGFTYGISRTRISSILGGSPGSSPALLRSHGSLDAALRAYASGKGDFADYLIREQSKTAGCQAVATFDSDLFGDDSFMNVPE